MSFGRRLVRMKVNQAPAFESGSELTPSTSWEEGEAITLTPDARGIITVVQVETELSGVPGLATEPFAQIGYSCENSGDTPKTGPDATLGSKSLNGATCATGHSSYSASGDLFVGKEGVPVIVRIWVKYTSSAGAPTQICWQRTRPTYDEHQWVASMVRQHLAHHRGGRL